MMRYEVRFEIDVEASNPATAATVARDMLLDPETAVLADVHEYKYCREADDEFPDHDYGWTADFRWGGVHPEHVFEWLTRR